MNIWISADLHLGHDKLIQHGRPEDFEERILDNLDNLGGFGSVWLCLGDVCIGNDSVNHAKVLGRMKVETSCWLIRGNHDRKTYTWYLRHGWDFVADQLLLNVHGFRILFTHIPQPPGDYDLNIHGHLHDTGHHPECGLHDGQILIKSEPEYRPVSLKSLLKGRTKPCL